MQDFLNEMADILEIDPETITLDTQFRDVPDWGSMMGFSIIVMVENEYHIKISVPEFLEMNTVGDIYARISSK